MSFSLVDYSDSDSEDAPVVSVANSISEKEANKTVIREAKKDFDYSVDKPLSTRSDNAKKPTVITTSREAKKDSDFPSRTLKGKIDFFAKKPEAEKPVPKEITRALNNDDIESSTYCNNAPFWASSYGSCVVGSTEAKKPEAEKPVPKEITRALNHEDIKSSKICNNAPFWASSYGSCDVLGNPQSLDFGNPQSLDFADTDIDLTRTLVTSAVMCYVDPNEAAARILVAGKLEITISTWVKVVAELDVVQITQHVEIAKHFGKMSPNAFKGSLKCALSEVWSDDEAARLGCFFASLLKSGLIVLKTNTLRIGDYTSGKAIHLILSILKELVRGMSKLETEAYLQQYVCNGEKEQVRLLGFIRNDTRR